MGFRDGQGGPASRVRRGLPADRSAEKGEACSPDPIAPSIQRVNGVSPHPPGELKFADLSLREQKRCLRILTAEVDASRFRKANDFKHYGYVLWGPYFFMSYDASVMARAALTGLRKAWFLRRVAARHGGTRLAWPPDLDG